jgi:hypothetical protein
MVGITFFPNFTSVFIFIALISRQCNIVIAGAISKKIPGGKQLVDKISSIVDKKKKVRTSKVGDKVRVPSPSYFFAFIREFNILCFDSILNGGYVLFKAVLISLVLIQATKDITNGDITNGAIVIAGAISKKILGGKQLVDKISSIVDKKKKVRTSKVGDKVKTPSPSNKDFVKLHGTQGYQNKYTGEIWKKSNTNHSGSVGGEWFFRYLCS